MLDHRLMMATASSSAIACQRQRPNNNNNSQPTTTDDCSNNNNSTNKMQRAPSFRRPASASLESHRKQKGRRKGRPEWPECVRVRKQQVRRKPCPPFNHKPVYLLLAFPLLLLLCLTQTQAEAQQQQQQADLLAPANKLLPDLVSATSGEPVWAIVGQDAFISCVAKNLQNYTIIWRYTNDADAPGADRAQAASPQQQPATGAQGDTAAELGVILTAGRQRVISDERFSVIQSHDTWLLKISNVRLADTGTYICQANSEPKVRVLRILSVIKPNGAAGGGRGGQQDSEAPDNKQGLFSEIDYNFTDCCRAEYVVPRCQRLCSFQQLASRYQSINLVHECFSALPSITRCMVAGRNVTDCCEKRHIPSRCNPMCGHLGDTSAMSVQDQSFCADYSASIMSCVAQGISTLPGQPELVIVEAVSSTTLKVSWQKVTDENELRKIDGWIINLTKLSSFEDTIAPATSGGGNARQQRQLSSTAASATTTAAAAAAAATDPQQQQPQSTPATTRVSSSFSANGGGPTPLASLTIVDVMNNSSLAAMTKLLAASSGTISLKLDKQSNEFSIDNLKPYTVYQIQMFAYNSLGRSQLTDPIRALTLAPESELSPATNAEAAADAYVEPSLPDTRKCCLDAGVTLRRCLDTLCDPVEADRATIADLMICAPWSNVTFGCLSSRVNHTDCCKSRGVSPFCLSMCSGEVKRVDYRHFRCLNHMSTYTNCILESHNVLPSAPVNFTVGPITHTWAVLNWRSPKKHARSLQGYRIFWRRVEPATSGSTPAPTNSSSGGGSGGGGGGTSLARPIDAQMGDAGGISPVGDEFFYSSAEAATNPYLLDGLQPETVYETFVVAVNKFGQSDSSVRFIFQTLADPDKLAANLNGGNPQGAGSIESRLPLHGNTKADSPAQTYYNETSCCVSSGVHNSCQQLCDYDLKVSDVSSLVTGCNTQMPVILRCMAGSRNSVPCCRNRGVTDQCLNVCAGLTEHSPLVVATRCASDFGKIIRCMDEGSKQIPSAPIDLHTLDIKPDRVTIKWAPASEDALRSDIEYHVRYQQLQQTNGGGGANGDQPLSSSDLSSLIAVVPLHPLEHNLILSTNRTEATVDKLKANSRYSIYVTAENSYGISLPSLVLVIQTPDESEEAASNAEQYKRRATIGAPHSLEILRSDTESIVLKWIAPLFIGNGDPIKYRVFYKLLASSSNEATTNTNGSAGDSSSGGQQSPNNRPDQPAPPESAAGSGDGAVQQLAATNWTVIETSDTTILLRSLRYSSQYVITVQAFSKQMLGHMSEILLASTAKPVPPTLNHPLVINSPIEGNNITIMCVALGQPTPQISMFINGLLVQKRTQPYVIYHLVNLVRGQLTITCFASNGHGKDYASVQSRTEVSVKFPSKAVAKAREVRVNPQSTARLTCEVSGNPQPTVVWTFTPRDPSSSERDASSSSSSGDTTSVSTAPAASPADLARTSVVTPSERVTTLLVSQFENPFTWSHTLTVRNVSQADLGLYQCRSRNLLAESVATIQLSTVERGPDSSASGELSYLKQVEQHSDLMECCRSQNVSAKCLPVCSVDGLDVETAFKTAECQVHLDKLMYCAADGSDHRNCCRTRQVPSSCLRWCSGAKLNIPALCFLSSAIDINQCFQEGRTLLPGPPQNVRVMLASDSEHGGERGADSPGATVATTTMSAHMLSLGAGGDKLMQRMPLALTSGGADPANGNNNNNNQPSVISSMVMMMGDGGQSSGSQSAPETTTSSASADPAAQADSSQHSEPLIVEWDPPAKNPSLVQYYRIFWRPFGSRELSRTVTNLTWIKLNDLNMNKIYEFVVKAANTHGSSVYSDPLTVKPAEILAQSNSIGAAGLTWWFMPSSGGASSLLGRVMVAICFATAFMFGSLALVMLLERRGYLKRFASSKSNNSRISFANPAYLKDSDGNQDGDNINWDSGHSLDILAPPPQTTTTTITTGQQASEQS